MAVIGITTCRKIEDYRQSILHIGGEPRILDPSMPLATALAGIDGLLLTGGEDVEPSRYGEAPHPTVVAAEKGRDEFEIGLVTAARAQRLPIFAICRGIQVLNVACGGTLVQSLGAFVRCVGTRDRRISAREPGIWASCSAPRHERGAPRKMASIMPLL